MEDGCMAKKPFTTTEEGNAAPEAFTEAPPVAPAFYTASPASSIQPPATSIQPLKPGVRKITLAQARAHHAKA